jgi:cyclic-di-AMP phosphodiesterase PgpH
MEERSQGREQMSSKTDVLYKDYPLMVILREKTPGTWSHSKNVVNLLESLSGELDIDIDTLRIAGMYHDIGKTVKPRFFSENQGDEDPNPHDELECYISWRFITAHVGDSTQILINDPNIPKEAITWVSQHHGDSVLAGIFRKSESANADDYRYRCSKPSSLEAAVLMICDKVEATAQALNQAGKLDDHGSLIDKIIRDLEDDEQLDLLTLGQLRKIRAVLKGELMAQFHKRVEYPDEEEEKATTPRRRRAAKK